MKVRVELGEDIYDVQLERVPGGFEVACEGDEDSATLSPTDAGLMVRFKDGRTVRVELIDDRRARIDGAEVGVHVGRFEPGLNPAALSTGGGLPVPAMMPGRLVRVMVKAGQAVEKGEPLLVLESMKMQNELLSPARGRVAEVLVAEGDVVESGRVLARLEPNGA